MSWLLAFFSWSYSPFNWFFLNFFLLRGPFYILFYFLLFFKVFLIDFFIWWAAFTWFFLLPLFSQSFLFSRSTIDIKTIFYDPVFEMFQIWIIFESWSFLILGKNYCFKDYPKSIYSQVGHFFMCIHKNWHLRVLSTIILSQNWLPLQCFFRY